MNAAARALAALLPRARCVAAVLADLLLRTASPRSSAHAPGRRSLPPARTAPSPPEPPRHYCPIARPRHPAPVPVVDLAPRSSARLPSLCHARVPALRDDDDATSRRPRQCAALNSSPAELPSAALFSPFCLATSRSRSSPLRSTPNRARPPLPSRPGTPPPTPWPPLLRRPPRNPFLRSPSTRATPENESLSAHRCSPAPPPPPQPTGTAPPRSRPPPAARSTWSSASAPPQPKSSPQPPSSPPTEAPKPGQPVPVPPASRRRGTEPAPPPPSAAPPPQAVPAQPETANRCAPTSSFFSPTGPHPR